MQARHTSLLFLLVCGRAEGLRLCHSRSTHGARNARAAVCMSDSVAAAVGITPIGPFCPFRSATCSDGGVLDQGMAGLSSKAPRFMTELTRLQLAMQAGSPVDPNEVKRVAADLNAAQSDWENLLTRMGVSDDFQSREYKKMTLAQLERSGQSLASIGLMMRWQADCMVAFADGQPPPFPPAGVDLQQMMEQSEAGGGSSPMSALGAANAITTTPFSGSEQVFDSPIVKEEYEALCRDHASLVKMGEGFGSFDPLGKIAFIDVIEAVEQRWDVLFSRFALLGAVNEEFRAQSSAFLEGMGLTPSQFRELLREAHALMRADAEEERGTRVA